MGHPAPVSGQIADVQGRQDTRNIAIDQVGIKDIKHPVIVADRSRHQQRTVANFCMYASLPHNHKGTHMSRFVEILNNHEYEITVKSLKNMVSEIVRSLDAESGYIQMSFPYFVEKTAPVSGATSLMDYQVCLTGIIDNENKPKIHIKVLVPVTTLCPCAKKISDYGAHSQRSHVTAEISSSMPVWIEEVIDIIEGAASSQLYSLLKRADEKYVTEHAYDNPKFVEDIVRDIAALLNEDGRIQGYTVESENFESIHNHSAYARINKA